MNPVVDALSLLKPYDIDRPKIRIGPKTDGGYIFADCLSNTQAVLSYGIGKEYGFDIEMARRGHEVFMFDHTIKDIQARNRKLHFYCEGVGGRTSASANLFSIHDHLNKCRIAGDRLILKADIEGAEYEALEGLPVETLSRFEQIILEVHWLNRLDEFFFRDRFCKVFRKLNSLFTLFHVHANNWNGQNGLSIVGGIPISSLLELSYIKSSLVQRRPSRTLYPTELDYPNITQFQEKLLWFYPFLPTSITNESFAECAARVEDFHDRQIALQTAPMWRRGADRFFGWFKPSPNRRSG
jgi:FkbM family methyltransferase